MIMSATTLDTELFKNIVDALPLCAIVIDDHRNIVYANEKVLTYFGYNRQSLPRKTIDKLVSKECRDDVITRIDDFIRSSEKTVTLNDGIGTLFAQRVDGSEFPVDISILRAKSKDGDYACVFFSDISRRSKLEHYLQNVISIDPITSLLNRRAFEERMKREHEREQRRDRIYGIFLMDIYKLQDINDEFGHDTGDKAIRIFADYCRNFFRKSDVVARWGDDEFIAFLPEVTEENAQAIADRLIESVKGITFASATGDRDVEIGVNIGVCLSTPVNSYHAVITQANESLLKAKSVAPNEIRMELLTSKIT